MIILSASTTLIAATAVFLLVLIVLVSILLYAKSKLVPSGDVTITINNDKELVVEAGTNLLNTLSSKKIFIPSACGGQGTCGMCRVQIPEGAGETDQAGFVAGLQGNRTSAGRREGQGSEGQAGRGVIRDHRD